MDPIDAYLEIRRAAAAAETRMIRAGRWVGLNPTQAVALVLLSRVGTQPVSHLGRALSVTGTTSTYLADGLERAGYATRRFSQTDRRVHDLVITDQGRAAAAAVLAALSGAEAQPKDTKDDRATVFD